MNELKNCSDFMIELFKKYFVDAEKLMQWTFYMLAYYTQCTSIETFAQGNRREINQK